MTITVRLPNELEGRLNHLVAQTGRAKSFYVKAALEAYLADLEEVLLAHATLERINAGKERTYSADEVRNVLKMDD